MTFLSWLFITAHYYPLVHLFAGAMFVAGGVVLLWTIDRAGGMV